MEKSPREKSVALARCRVLYIGTALPTETSEGCDAVQKPLRERYNTDGKLEGIDARIIIYSDGIQLQFIDDQKTVIWFPILSLHVCAAVKCVNIINAATGNQGHSFVPLDNIKTELKDISPPIFAMITRRVRGIKILECHSFVCKSDAAAMALVQCCTHAYETKDVDRKPFDEDGLNTTPMTEQGDVGYKAWISSAHYKEVPTTPGGYYIGDGENLVKNYGIWTNANKMPSKRPQTLGPSHLPRGPPLSVKTGPPSPVMDGTMPRGTPRIAYVPASMLRNVNRQTGAGTIDAGTLNKYLQTQRPTRPPEDDTKSFYMYPQDKPRLSYWQSSVPMVGPPAASVLPPPDYDRPNSTFTYPPQRLATTHEYAPGAEPNLPPQNQPSSPVGRDRSPSQRLREPNGLPQYRVQPRPIATPPIERRRHPDGRPITPPPDYDLEQHFDGYWHGYIERSAKQNLNELMKKRASQALDERVHEEIYLSNGAEVKEPEGLPKWRSGSKIFSNERAFSRSIQMEMDTKPGGAQRTSAYDLIEGQGKPFVDLDETLGYFP